MAKHSVARVSVCLFILLTAALAACATAPTDSGPAVDTPSREPSEPPTPAPAPKPARKPAAQASRETPPDRPWTAPERKFLSPTDGQDVTRPGYPYGLYIDLMKEWEASNRLSKGTHNSPPLVLDQGDGVYMYSEYTIQADEFGEDEKVATGFALLSLRTDVVTSGHWLSLSPSDPGTVGWIYLNLKGELHGPCYMKWQRGPDVQHNTREVGAYVNNVKTGIWWECNEEGNVVAVGRYSNGVRTGVWKYFSEYGLLEAIGNEAEDGTATSEKYEYATQSRDGKDVAGIQLVSVAQLLDGKLDGDVADFDFAAEWFCVMIPFRQGERCDGWWTFYDPASRRRVRDEWRNAKDVQDGPVLDYDADGNVTSRQEYKEGKRVGD
ncbi:MAG: hypothetical protein IPP14_05000 [Planctomycetes bacterium]|nr:hypothetical protein [Planctomycetota bacterium]